MKKRHGARSSHEAAQDAASLALAEGGSAADAIVAGWFALAGADRAGLLAPLIALVAGPGVGARAFDGRALQPGMGVPRPRGAVAGAPLERASFAAVSRSFEVAQLVHAEHGRKSLAELCGRGIDVSSAGHSKLRAGVLRKLVREGAPPLRTGAYADALLRAAGLNAGGLLTAEDLEHPASRSVAAAETRASAPSARNKTPGLARLISVPWAPAIATSARACAAHVILAADPWGMVAAMAVFVGCSSSELGELVVAELDVALPLCAVPVRRGLRRVAPGTIIAVDHPVAIVEVDRDVRAAVGAPGGTLAAEDVASAAALRAYARGTRMPVLAAVASDVAPRPRGTA